MVFPLYVKSHLTYCQVNDNPKEIKMVFTMIVRQPKNYEFWKKSFTDVLVKKQRILKIIIL